MASYEKSNDDMRNSRVYEYDSLDCLIKEIDGTMDMDVFDCFNTDWGVTVLLKILPKVSVNQECSNVKYQSGRKLWQKNH